MEYFIILLSLFLITFVLEKIYRVHLYHNRRERLEVVGLFFIVGVIWDSFAVIREHWVFPPGSTLGITIGVLPLEEYLFMLVIPYFIITLYKILDSKFRKHRKA